MDRNNQYFYFSGFLSLSIFTIFISLFLYGLFNIKDIKNYALEKEEFVSISLQSVNVESTSPKKTPPAPVVKDEPTPIQEPQEKSEVQNAKKEINIDNLFSSVTTKDLKKDTKEEKKEDNRVVDNIQKKSDSPKKNISQTLSSMVESMNADKRSEKNEKTSGGNEVNEYFAKIQAMIYDNFFPPSSSEGRVVKVVIELNALGKLVDFRVISYSNHDGLNQEVDKIRDRLKNLIFPKNPDNKSGTYTINLRPEEKSWRY